MRYGPKAAVDQLTLTVPEGAITAVLGPNGAGKTTTIETCAGYRRPQAGSVRVLGLDPVREHARLAPRIGVMLQAGGAWSGIRAGEMLRYLAGLYAHPLDPAVLVDRLGLSACGRTPYRRLSGGQQQRLRLAMALVGRPQLVFLDEPTAGLDPQARHAAWDLMEELRADGVTVVLATHHMDEAERLADHVYVIDAGRVVAAGTPTELTTRGAQNSIIFSARRGLDLLGLRKALPDGFAVEETRPGVYRIQGDLAPDVLAQLTAWCAGQGVMPEGLSVQRHSLEEVFFELTGRGQRA